jgi:hypothetical protein
MRILQLVRRHPLPAILSLAALAALSTIGIRALSSPTADEQIAMVERNSTADPVAFAKDSRFTVWQPGEYVPESEPTTEVKPSPAPLPKPNAWSQLSSLDVSLGATTEQNSRELELPAPAGLDDSMNPFERDRLIAAASVETGYQGSGPIILPSYRVRPDVCVPGRDHIRVQIRSATGR